MADESNEERASNNPYAILILAVPFILGGLLLVFQTGEGAINLDPHYRAPGSYHDVISPSMVHGIGAIALLVGGALTLFYFYVRREIQKGESPSDEKP